MTALPSPAGPQGNATDQRVHQAHVWSHRDDTLRLSCTCGWEAPVDVAGLDLDEIAALYERRHRADQRGAAERQVTAALEWAAIAVRAGPAPPEQGRSSPVTAERLDAASALEAACTGPSGVTWEERIARAAADVLTDPADRPVHLTRLAAAALGWLAALEDPAAE